MKEKLLIIVLFHNSVPGLDSGHSEALVGGVDDARIYRGQQFHQTASVRHYLDLQSKKFLCCRSGMGRLRIFAPGFTYIFPTVLFRNNLD